MVRGRWSSGGRRAAIIAAALAGWALVIGGAGGPEALGERWVGVPPIGTILFVVLAVLAVAVVTLVVVSFVLGPSIDQPLPERRPLWPSLVLLAAVVFLLSRFDRPDGATSQREQADPTPVDDVDAVAEPVVRVLGGAGLVSLLATLVVAVVAIVWTRRRMATGDVTSATADDAAAIEPVIERLAERLVAGEPRAAVILAYAEFETSLGERGWARQSVETPAEHVRRVLGTLPELAAPLVDLANLYEVARFSQRPITDDERRRAAADLADLTGRLRSSSGEHG